MKNGYCRLSTLARAVNADGVTGENTALLAARDAASRMVENVTGRRFYSEIATAEYDGNGRDRLWLGWHAAEPFRADLIAPTTVKVDDNLDGTFELTLVENIDYWLHPDNPTVTKVPAEALDIVSGRTTAPQIYCWPKSRRCVQVVGKFGYSEITELVGTTAEALDSSETGVDLTSGHGLEVGDNFFVDSEEFYISAFDTPNTATVVRGINGTTAASHDTAASVYLRRYPEDIERAVVADAARWMWRNVQGDYNERGMPWQAIRESLGSYGKGGVGQRLAVG